jgi:hypothetical protein
LYWKTYFCEICKFKLPRKLLIGPKEIELIGPSRPKNEPYLILESMATEDSYNIQSIYTLKFNNYNHKQYTLRLGRKDCEIKIPHTSISRLHATIVFSKGEFRLFDKNSKYGTLLKLKKPLKITHQKQGL